MLNGRLIAWAEATVHVSAHGLHYGSGVFEGIRCYATEHGPALFRLDAHLARLFGSAATIGLEIPYSPDQLGGMIAETIVANGFADCYVRPICYYGSRSLALRPEGCPVEVAVLTWPWSVYLGAAESRGGVRVSISTWRKPDALASPIHAKVCGAYLNGILASNDAAGRGYDEALMLDAEGRIAEGPVQNLFVVRAGRLFTNGGDGRILDGITRDAVLQIAADVGLEVVIGPLDVADLWAADEAFFTGTATEIAPVVEVDGVPVGDGGRGPVTGRLQLEYAAAVRGRNQRYAHWLSPVTGVLR
jgi:branched-chain amino acid aminotransferase